MLFAFGFFWCLSGVLALPDYALWYYDRRGAFPPPFFVVVAFAVLGPIAGIPALLFPHPKSPFKGRDR